jgi:hypothetical protein
LRLRWTPSWGMRLPTIQKQPSFLESTCTSSPARGVLVPVDPRTGRPLVDAL